ncbi:hypothetical protein [Burkholderia lata]|uniref:Uncharacterized protein n=1 Tax=Burkholderia lata (strain ATCC 17760 / DSM 23089 / LMG 22485 / NCIMB 9086 / R18194 / 383) TaxID=482957 RepID=A0A6P2GVU2_BURL3|nr:hypothetical protein [Burkholderia lata]VWB07469.1 hypothetical protein BLA6863_00170 [Burkholderia lata]
MIDENKLADWALEVVVRANALGLVDLPCTYDDEQAGKLLLWYLSDLTPAEAAQAMCVRH